MKLVIEISKGLKDAFNYEEQWTALLCAEMRDVLQNATPLPKGHGDLIDRDELIGDIMAKTFGLRVCDIEKVPTIIAADKENEV